MLVLGAKEGDRIYVGESIVLKIVRIDRARKCQIGIEAPKDVKIERGKVREQRKANAASNKS